MALAFELLAQRCHAHFTALDGTADDLNQLALFRSPHSSGPLGFQELPDAAAPREPRQNLANHARFNKSAIQWLQRRRRQVTGTVVEIRGIEPLTS